eukprot:TRINITY_DN11829_c0_g2_i1.p2 TRINITY_DN11829_c0_g2~~TRINITY_DN11829_c0_g2_i1.p2  ORF type:complete len:100 (+),score=4.09 TRINITY_DN11829_c0_g2_i1:315-614(+)
MTGLTCVNVPHAQRTFNGHARDQSGKLHIQRDSPWAGLHGGIPDGREAMRGMERQRHLREGYLIRVLQNEPTAHRQGWVVLPASLKSFLKLTFGISGDN